MNIIDIIIVAVAAIAIVMGLKDGAIGQLGTLAGIIISIFLAKSFGSEASALLGIGGTYSHIWGYAIVLVVSLVAVSLVAKLLRQLISAVGLGPLDRIAGALLSLVKYGLILSIAFSLFAMVNGAFGIVEQRKFDESQLYKPVLSISKYIMPAVEWVEEQLPLDNTQKDE